MSSPGPPAGATVRALSALAFLELEKLAGATPAAREGQAKAPSRLYRRRARPPTRRAYEPRARASPLGPILPSGADETLEFGRSRSDPVLIGDQRPQGRTPAPGPPDPPSGLTRAQLSQTRLSLTPVSLATAPALRPRPPTTARAPQPRITETTGFLGVRATEARRRGSAAANLEPVAAVAPDSGFGQCQQDGAPRLGLTPSELAPGLSRCRRRLPLAPPRALLSAAPRARARAC